jgi:hypothetical protein
VLGLGVDRLLDPLDGLVVQALGHVPSLRRGIRLRIYAAAQSPYRLV